MSNSQIEKLNLALDQASALFNRLLLLSGSAETGKTTLLRRFSDDRGCPILNVSLKLSQALLDLPRMKRPRQVDRLFGGLIYGCEGELVVLDDLEVLFDTALQLDPLRLLKLHSRNKTLVASWNGAFHDGMLTYAEPDHPEYKSYRDVDVVVVPIAKEPNSSH